MFGVITYDSNHWTYCVIHEMWFLDGLYYICVIVSYYCDNYNNPWYSADYYQHYSVVVYTYVYICA